VGSGEMGSSKELVDRATQYQRKIPWPLEKIGLCHCLTDTPVAVFRQLGEFLGSLSGFPTRHMPG